MDENSKLLNKSLINAINALTWGYTWLWDTNRGYTGYLPFEIISSPENREDLIRQIDSLVCQAEGLKEELLKM